MAEIVSRCARLPLALAMVATRAMAHPAFRLADLARELRAAGGALDAPHRRRGHCACRTSWSLALSPPAVRLFRLLGAHCGRDVSVATVAAWRR